jgi:hypothetical protein
MDDAMADAARQRLLRGRDDPPPGRTELRAGPVRVVLDGIDLRELAVGDVPLVDRIYVAVRDRDWGTVPAQISDLDVRSTGAGFAISFTARHRTAEIDLGWQGTIVGDRDGTITCTMDGQADSAFAYCRIGFCILHPDSLAGARYTARTPDGEVQGTFPTLVAPQSIVDGVEQALFAAFDTLEVEASDGTSVRFELAGDLFETEDQRNWTDASFKTYGTPLARGYPYQAQPGQRFAQRVTIRVGLPPARPAAGRAAAAVRSSGPMAFATATLGADTGRALPSVGLGVASDGSDLAPREVELLGALRLDHVRVDVRPAVDGWRERLDTAARQAGQLGCALEVALFVPEGRGAVASEVADRVGGVRIARWLVLDERTAGLVTTPARHVAAVRGVLDGRGAMAPIAGGTDGDFAELNRARPELEGIDAVSYAVNPRVHAADDRSIMENVTAQGASVETARSFAPGRGIVVSPVTLAARFNPVASGAPAPTPTGELPSAVDWRQPSLLGAAWTVGSIAALSAAGADAVTWFETVGWRGLIEREGGSPLPERFASSPGMVFPMYHVFADLAELREGTRVETHSSAPRALTGLAVRRGDRLNGLFANLTPDALPVAIGPVGPEVRFRVLDESTAGVATGDPDAFRRSGAAQASVDGWLRLTLGPYATVVLGADAVPSARG